MAGPLLALAALAVVGAPIAAAVAVYARRRKRLRELVNLSVELAREFGMPVKEAEEMGKMVAEAVKRKEMSFEDGVKWLAMPYYAAILAKSFEIYSEASIAMLTSVLMNIEQYWRNPEALVEAIASAILAGGKPAILAREGDVYVVAAPVSRGIRYIALKRVGNELVRVRGREVLRTILEKGIVKYPNGAVESARIFLARLEVATRPSTTIT